MNNLFRISFVIVSVIVMTQCASNVVPIAESQERVNANTAVAIPRPDDGAKIRTMGAVLRPDDEAKIDGKLEKINLPDLKLETFISQPAPHIWFVFPCQETEKEKCAENSFTMELNNEAKNLLSDYWRKALTYIYKSYLKKDEYMLDGDIYYKTATEHSNNSFEFERNIKKVFIEAPKRKRQISDGEAWEIIGFINKSAFEIAKQAKNN